MYICTIVSILLIVHHHYGHLLSGSRVSGLFSRLISSYYPTSRAEFPSHPYLLSLSTLCGQWSGEEARSRLTRLLPLKAQEILTVVSVALVPVAAIGSVLPAVTAISPTTLYFRQICIGQFENPGKVLKA